MKNKNPFTTSTTRSTGTTLTLKNLERAFEAVKNQPSHPIYYTDKQLKWIEEMNAEIMCQASCGDGTGAKPSEHVAGCTKTKKGRGSKSTGAVTEYEE